MKHGRRTLMIVMVFAMLLALAASLPAAAQKAGPPSGTELDETEIHHLQFIREEEKLAHDVYTVLYEKWGSPIFANIAESEQKHTDAMANLLAYYDVDDPYVEGIGNFSDTEGGIYIKGLYELLTEWGLKSEVDAMLVGGYIEEYDILDIWLAHDETDEERIQTVYVNLYEGSYNHLDGFVHNYNLLSDVDYVPQLLEGADYEYVLSCVDKAPKHPDKNETTE